jgi:hypothetical protein
MVWLVGTLLAGQGPTIAHAQAGAFPVEEASISDLEAAYLAGRTTARAVTQAPGAAPTALTSSLTFVASGLQWPAISVASGYLGGGLPQGLQILGRPWQEAKIIGYAFAYEQATHHRRAPVSTPPLGR